MPVKAIGADRVENEFRKLASISPNTQKEFLDIISEQTIKLLRLNTPRETGTLANSWREISRSADTIIISATDDQTKKVQYIIFGTRDHDIRPKTPDGVLHWRDSQGDHYARKVHHPGTQPNNFIASVLAAISANVDATMRRLMKQSHHYYSNIGAGSFTGFGTQSTPRTKHTKTPSDTVGLTGLKFVKRRGRGKSYIGRVTLKPRKLTRRIGIGRRRV